MYVTLKLTKVMSEFRSGVTKVFLTRSFQLDDRGRIVTEPVVAFICPPRSILCDFSTVKGWRMSVAVTLSLTCCQVLIATDVLSRGIDVPAVTLAMFSDGPRMHLFNYSTDECGGL